MDAILQRCAGIDVGKKFSLVCLITDQGRKAPNIQIRTYGTTVAELDQLHEWLKQAGCTHVVMESTASYLEADLQCSGRLDDYRARKSSAFEECSGPEDRCEGLPMAS